MRTATLLVVMLVLLALAVALAFYLWSELGDVDISVWGWVSLIGGVLATLALGGGLMALVFYSNRRGFDDDVDGR